MGIWSRLIAKAREVLIYQCIFSLLSSNFYHTLFETKDVIPLENETTKQPTCDKRESLDENKITLGNAHKTFIRKKSFESLFENEFTEKEKKIPKFIQDSLKHGRRYEPVARRKCYEIMKCKMKRNIFLEKLDLLYNHCCSG